MGKKNRNLWLGPGLWCRGLSTTCEAGMVLVWSPHCSTWAFCSCPWKSSRWPKYCTPYFSPTKGLGYFIIIFTVFTSLVTLSAKYKLCSSFPGSFHNFAFRSPLDWHAHHVMPVSSRCPLKLFRVHFSASHFRDTVMKILDPQPLPFFFSSAYWIVEFLVIPSFTHSVVHSLI